MGNDTRRLARDQEPTDLDQSVAPGAAVAVAEAAVAVAVAAEAVVVAAVVALPRRGSR